MAEKKKKGFSLTPFSIIMILLIIVAIITMFVAGQPTGIEDGTVTGATFSMIIMSIVNGFSNAMEVIIFVFILGGFLGLVAHSGALETGIAALVKKLHGHELVIIPVLMFIFSICGSTYGMLEESVGFYALLAGTMVAAGMDTIVGSAVVLLGAGSGVLGSTVNPFAVGAALDAAKGAGVEVNSAIMMAIGAILWVVAYAISVFFVYSYAKKVKADKGSTLLSLQEQEAMMAEYGNKEVGEDVKLTGRQKAILVLFALTFLVMIVMFIPWSAFNVDMSWSAWLFGVGFGDTYMLEAATWFLIMGLIIGIIDMAGREKNTEKKVVDTFIAGCTDMMSVCLVIAVSRGVSVLMSETHFSDYLVTNVGGALGKLPEAVFTPLNYLFHVVLSVLVPSSSGIAALSGGIMAPIASGASFSVEVTLMTMVAANGLVNLITPTCGAIMGGLALARVDYSTWVKFAAKIVAVIGVVSMVVLTVCTFIF